MNKMKDIFSKYHKMNQSAKATIWFVICSFVQRGITVLSTPVFTRLMTTQDYGIYNVFISWLEIFTVIITLRLCYGSYMRDLVKHPDDRDIRSSSLLGLSLILVLGWFAGYLMFCGKINRLLGLTFPMMICMFVMILDSTWFGFWSARERVDYNYKKLIAVTIVISILKPASGVTFILFTPNSPVMARIVSVMLVEVLIYTGLFIAQMRKGKVFYQRDLWKSAVKFNIPLVPHYLSQIVLNHSDRIMINYYEGSEAAGIYSLAYSMAMIMVLFNTSLQNTITPWNYQRLEEGDYSAMRKMGNLSAILIAAINFVLILIAPEAIAVFSPSAYHEAVYVIPPVAMGVFFMFIYGLFVNVEMYYKKNNYVMTASVMGAVLNIILNAVFIPVFGYVAAAYTTLASYMIYSGMHGVFAGNIRRKENITENFYDYRTIIVIGICFMMLSFLAMFTYALPVIRYSLILGTVIVCVSMKKKMIQWLKQVMRIQAVS